MKKIAISGGSGFVGKELKEKLLVLGFEPLLLGRDDLKDSEKLAKKIDGCFGVVNLAGAPIISRWNEKYKKILIDSRIDTTKNIVDAISKVTNKPEVFISTSAVGIYKDGKIFDEYSKDCFDDTFLGSLCKRWEDEALKAKSSSGIRVSIFRFGVVLGSGGGMMQKVLKPFSFGLGGVISSGKQGFSWIDIDDLIEILLLSIEDRRFEGIYNMTSPNPTDNREFTKTLGNILNRPTLIPTPAFLLKLIFSEGAKVLIEGQKVYPKRLIEEIGYKFKYSTLKESLIKIVKKG